MVAVREDGLRVSERYKRLQIPAPRLLAFDRFEERLEVALAETAAAFALDDFIKQGRPVFDRLGENLQHVAFVVAVHQNAEAAEIVLRLVNRTGARGEILIISRRHAQKLDALPA